jgi:hypothetical protein
MGTARVVALGLALAWSVVLVVGAFVVPVYSTDGSTGPGSSTLVGENGAGVVGVMVVPLVLVLLVSAALWRNHLAAGWSVTGVLAVFNLLALLSIGVFVLPVTVGLIIACAKPPRYVRADASQRG